jgi:hypothetical protein
MTGGVLAKGREERGGGRRPGRRAEKRLEGILLLVEGRGDVPGVSRVVYVLNWRFW